MHRMADSRLDASIHHSRAAPRLDVRREVDEVVEFDETEGKGAVAAFGRRVSGTQSPAIFHGVATVLVQQPVIDSLRLPRRNQVLPQAVPGLGAPEGPLYDSSGREGDR